jgi:transposase
MIFKGVNRVTNLQKFSDLENLVLGLDLGKKESQLAIIAKDGKLITNFRFHSTRENFLRLAQFLKQTHTIALEVSPSSNEVAHILKANSKAAILLSNPLQTKLIAQAKVKTDKIDARVLAELARVGFLPTVWLPDQETIRLRHLFTDRESLVARKTELKNMVHSILHRNLISVEFSDLFSSEGFQFLDQLMESDTLDAFEKDSLRFLLAEEKREQSQVADIDSLIAGFVQSVPRFRHQLDLLLSIPGVSLVTGAGILSAIGEIKRFSSAKKLASYFGLTPRVYQSGNTRRVGRISKQGNAYARFLAIEAAEHYRKAHGPIRRLYERIAKKKNHNVAVTAVARKLIELIFHLLTREEEFLYSKPRLTDEKRARVRQLAATKSGLEMKRKETDRTLYGTNLRGRDVKAVIQNQACELALKLYDNSQLKKETITDISSSGFNPNRPKTVDWQKVLEIVAKRIELEKLSKQKRT